MTVRPTSFETIQDLLNLKGGEDTGYMEGRVPFGSDGEPGLNCKGDEQFQLKPAELRVQCLGDGLLAALRVPVGTIAQPILCSGQDGRLAAGGAIGAQRFEELHLELQPGGDARLFGLPAFGVDRVPLIWHDQTRSREHEATISQCFGFATARLAGKIASRTSGPPKPYDDAMSSEAVAAAMLEAAQEVSDNIRASAATYLYPLAGQLVERARLYRILIGEDTGARFVTTFMEYVLRATGFTGQTSFLDTSKLAFTPSREGLYLDHLARLADSQAGNALFVTESVFTGTTARRLAILAGQAFGGVDFASTATSTITSPGLAESIICPTVIKPGTASQFVSFEGVPLPPAMLSRIIGVDLPPDCTSIARPLGWNGYRYYPDTSVLTGVQHDPAKLGPLVRPVTCQEPPIADALTKTTGQMQRLAAELAEEYVASM